MTFFFHLIPGVTESLTRLPVDAPIASGPDDPLVQKLVGICFLLFIAGASTGDKIAYEVKDARERGGSLDVSCLACDADQDASLE